MHQGSLEVKRMLRSKIGFGSNLKDIHHLKEHNKGIGDGKADAKDKYEIVDDEDLGKCDYISMSQ